MWGASRGEGGQGATRGEMKCWITIRVRGRVKFGMGERTWDVSQTPPTHLSGSAAAKAMPLPHPHPPPPGSWVQPGRRVQQWRPTSHTANLARSEGRLTFLEGEMTVVRGANLASTSGGGQVTMGGRNSRGVGPSVPIRRKFLNGQILLY